MKRNKKFLLEFTKNDLSHVVDMGNEITVAYEIELDSRTGQWVRDYAESTGYFVSNSDSAYENEEKTTIRMIYDGRWKAFLTFDAFNRNLRIKSQDVSTFNVGDAFIAWLESINENKANYYIATTLINSGYLDKFNLDNAFKKRVETILNDQYGPDQISGYILVPPSDEKFAENLANVLFSSEDDKDILLQILDSIIKYIPEISKADSEFAYIGDNLRKIYSLIGSGGEYTQYKKDFEDSLVLLLSLDQFRDKKQDITFIIQRIINFIQRKNNARTDFLKKFIKGTFNNTGKEQEIEFIENNLYGPFDKNSSQYAEIIEHVRNNVSQSAIVGDINGYLKNILLFFNLYYDNTRSRIDSDGYEFSDGLQVLDEDADERFSIFLRSAILNFAQSQADSAMRVFKQTYPEEFSDRSVIDVENLSKEQFAEIAREAIADLFPTTYSKWGDLLEFDQEGSLLYGLEFFPQTYMTLSDALLFIKDLYADYENQETFFFSDKTGLHINVGIEGESNFDWNYFKLFLFLNEKFATEGFEQRLESNYSKQIKSEIEKYVSQESGHSKYSNKDLVDYVQSLEKVSLDDVLTFETMFNEMMRGYSQKNVGFLVRSGRVEFRYPGGTVSLEDVEKATLYYSYLVLLAHDNDYKKEEYFRKAVSFLHKIKDRSVKAMIRSKDQISNILINIRSRSAQRPSSYNNAYTYILKSLRSNPESNRYFKISGLDMDDINKIIGRQLFSTDSDLGILRCSFLPSGNLPIAGYDSIKLLRTYFFKIESVSKDICEISIPKQGVREFASVDDVGGYHINIYKANTKSIKAKISTEALAAIIENYTQPPGLGQASIIDDLIRGGESEYIRRMSSACSPWFGFLYKMYSEIRSEGVIVITKNDVPLLNSGDPEKYKELYDRVKIRQEEDLYS